MPSKKGVKEYFVVEDLFSMPDEKMHTELSQTLIKENAVLPQQRKAKVMQHAEAPQLFNPDNPVLKGFGVTMEKDSHKLAIGVRKLPKIKMDDGKIVAPDVRKSTRLLEPAKIGNMVVLYKFGRERYRHSMRQFMKISEKRAREKGIELGACSFQEFRADWPATFDQVARLPPFPSLPPVSPSAFDLCS